MYSNVITAIDKILRSYYVSTGTLTEKAVLACSPSMIALEPPSQWNGGPSLCALSHSQSQQHHIRELRELSLEALPKKWEENDNILTISRSIW